MKAIILALMIVASLTSAAYGKGHGSSASARVYVRSTPLVKTKAPASSDYRGSFGTIGIISPYGAGYYNSMDYADYLLGRPVKSQRN
jgi:hypothetical protein